MWFILWIILSFVVGSLGSKRTIGYGWALFWSLIFSPIIGVIIVLCYPRKEDVEYKERMLAATRRAAEKSELDELIKAKSLLDQGVLSSEEFAKIKFRITGISTSSDENKSSEETSVSVHIRHLRQKLEINPSEPRYLKVVWGLGYKMEDKK